MNPHCAQSRCIRPIVKSNVRIRRIFICMFGRSAMGKIASREQLLFVRSGNTQNKKKRYSLKIEMMMRNNKKCSDIYIYEQMFTMGLWVRAICFAFLLSCSASIASVKRLQFLCLFIAFHGFVVWYLIFLLWLRCLACRKTCIGAYVVCCVFMCSRCGDVEQIAQSVLLAGRVEDSERICFFSVAFSVYQ